jgi:uncharacterized DUF497 family protein
MDFDWHRAKSEACRRDRGFDFAYAARVFAGPVLEQVDDRRNYGEVRMRALGEIDGSLYVVVFTDRFDADDAPVRWIISARRAHQKERQKWLSDR